MPRDRRGEQIEAIQTRGERANSQPVIASILRRPPAWSRTRCSPRSRIWCEVLRDDQIGIRENFFDVGGDSLRAVAVAGPQRPRLHGDRLGRLRPPDRRGAGRLLRPPGRGVRDRGRVGEARPARAPRLISEEDRRALPPTSPTRTRSPPCSSACSWSCVPAPTCTRIRTRPRT